MVDVGLAIVRLSLSSARQVEEVSNVSDSLFDLVERSAV